MRENLSTPQLEFVLFRSNLFFHETFRLSLCVCRAVTTIEADEAAASSDFLKKKEKKRMRERERERENEQKTRYRFLLF